MKGEAYFTYTLTLYGVLHVVLDRPSPDTHLRKPNMNEQQNFLHYFDEMLDVICEIRKKYPREVN